MALLRDERGKFAKATRPDNIIEWFLQKKKEFGFEYDYMLAERLGIKAENLSKILAGKYGLSAIQVQAIITNLNYKQGSEDYNHLLDLFYRSRLKNEATWNKTKNNAR